MNLLIKYGLVIGFLAFLIFIFSMFMVQVASYRGMVSTMNYQELTNIYNGPVTQAAPSLNMLDEASSLYQQNNLTKESLRRFADNTFLTGTDADVGITADFVKKGLVYQPSYRTAFSGKYTLKNTLNEDSFVKFEFPFPVNTLSTEISNAKLIVNGVEVPDAKGKVTLDSSDGLKWEGKIPKNQDSIIEVSYNTVGLSIFNYEGLENSKKAQDFKFSVQINGTRAYNVSGGLSVDQREFGENYVKLVWNKQDLYSRPLINVSVGEKLNPSEQVARVYYTMAPVFVVFMAILCFLAYRFSKGLRIFDIVMLTVLFVVYFPLIHYLSSFTIDPTMEIFAGISNVGEFSMPLYGAFGLAWLVIGGLMFYYLGRIADFKFAAKMGIPAFVLFLGFFPLVVTIPEYSILLVLIGVIALTAIIIQTRIKMIE